MNKPPSAAENEIVSTRLFDVPRARVFTAFADPAQLTRWFGPDGFTSTFTTFDFKPGGEWTFTFHGPNGTDYPNHCKFAEIVGNERIVYDHITPPHFRMTMKLADDGDGTQLTWRMGFADVPLCEALKLVCVPANEQNFNRLAEHLTQH